MTPSLLFLLACTGAKEPNLIEPISPIKTETKAEPERPKTETIHVDLSGSTQLSTQFAVRLNHVLMSGAGPTNVLYSPSSAQSALGMTLLGANGKTRTAMKTALSIPQETDGAELLGQLQNSWDGYSGPGELTVVNRIWVDNTVSLLPTFEQQTTLFFNASTASADFIGAPNDSRLAINGWVSDQTKKRIPDLLTPPVITSNTRLVLVNAVYFLADWARPFKANQTRELPFALVDSDPVPVQTMFQSQTFRYGELGGVQGVELPYRGERFAMRVFLAPKDSGLDGLDGIMSAKFLNEWSIASSRQKVNLWLPKFELKDARSLSEPLTKLGMGVAFSKAADFTGMIDDVELYISDVVQSVFVKVDETGTEAAAATAVIMETRSAMVPVQPKVFRADRPFLFMIWDNELNAPLFVGRVTDPR